MFKARSSSRVSSKSSRSNSSVPMRTITRNRVSHETVNAPFMAEVVEKDRPSESKLERMLRLTATRDKHHVKDRGSSLSHRSYES